MCCLLITVPISGGHLNPAITFAVWLTSSKPKERVWKMLGMIVAQCLGGFIGIAFGRMVRIDLVTSPKTYYPSYN